MADDQDIALVNERRRAIRALLAAPLLLPESDESPISGTTSDLGIVNIPRGKFAHLIRQCTA
ncbi:MAG TPA: hypothetical protein VFG35_30230 [Actinoplanes sp.]|nr:hypothetical protein [Actinoplanes sp.]